MSTTERDERLREARERAAEVRAGQHVVPPTFERALLALDDEVTRLDAVVTAVRDVHREEIHTFPDGRWNARCTECSREAGRTVLYPCPTVRALDGGAA